MLLCLLYCSDVVIWCFMMLTTAAFGALYLSDQCNLITTCVMIVIIVVQLIVGRGVASSFVSDLRSSIIFLPKESF